MVTRAKEVGAIGVVRGDEVYGLTEFCQRMRWGRHALRSARKAGLRTVRRGGRVFVLGSDVLAFLSRDDTEA